MTPTQENWIKKHYKFFTSRIQEHISDGSLLAVKTLYEDFIRQTLAERDREWMEKIKEKELFDGMAKRELQNLQNGACKKCGEFHYPNQE